MALIRTETWDTQELNRFLIDHERDQFAYGAFDCCLFAADAIQVMTGVDIATEFRGKYKTELGALKAIRKITGGTSVEDAITYCAAQHGLTEWRYPLQAQRGDLVAIENGESIIAGIVHLNGKHVISIGESGLIRLPLTAIKRAWRTGNDPVSPRTPKEQMAEQQAITEGSLVFASPVRN